MLNQIFLQGRLVKAPELRQTQSGMSVASFTVASNGYVKGNEKDAVFLECTAFDKTAESIAKFFDKGSMLIVCGQLKQQQWTDKESGKKRTKLCAIVHKFEFCGAGEASQAEAGESAEQAPASADELEDDLPF